MPNKIELGIDVDTRTVASGERAVDNLNRALRGTQREMAGTAHQAQGLTTSMRGVSDLARGVGAAMTGIVGGAFIRSLMDTTMQLQRINMTFLSVTGSAAAAASEMAYVRETADKLGQEVLGAAGAYAKMLAAADASNIPLQATRNVFEGITAAATAFGLSQYELQGALNAVQQMISKGSVQAEELRGQLGERLPGAFAIAAESMNMTVAELSKALELGQVSAVEFVTAFGPELQARFGAFAENADTSQRAVNELETAMLDLRTAVIEGGFQEALIKVLDTLTALAGSEEAIAVARGIGSAFAFMAENAEIAALGLGAIVAAVTPFGKMAALVAGVVGALAALSQRVVQVGNDQMKVADIIGDQLGRVTAYATTLASFMATQWVAAFVAARVATLTFVGALATLRAALLRLGFTAIVVVAGELVYRFMNLVEAAGSFGKALSLLANVAKAVWQGLITSAGAIPPGLAAIWERVKSAFYSMVQGLAVKWENFLFNMSMTAKDAGLALSALDNAAASAGATVTGLGDAIVKADADAAQFEQTASGKLKGAFDGVGKAVSEIQNVMGRAANDQNWNTIQGAMAGTAARGREAAAAANDITTAVEGTTDASKEAQKAEDERFKRLMRNLKEELDALVKVEKRWSAIRNAISEALGALTTGDLEGGATGMVTAIKDALWGEDMKKAFDDVAGKIQKAIRGAMERGGGGGGSMLGLDSTTMALAGTSMANAAVGALEGNSTQIGAGIGSAAGAIIGNLILPGIGGFIGSALGGAAGGFLAQAFGGEDKWQRPTGTAFTGTTYASDVTGSRNVNIESGESHAGKFAFQGVKNLLAAFNKELRQYVDETGGAVKKGTDLIVNQTKALKLITGTLSDRTANRAGETEEEAGKRIAEKVQEIMAIAGLLAQGAAEELTTAQQLWREAQERFSKENVEILRALGFSAKAIADAQAKIRNELVTSFNMEMLGTIVDLKAATAKELALWRDMQLAELRKREKQALATAREIGASLNLVRAAFRAQRLDIANDYKELLNDLAEGTGAAADAIARQIARATERINALTRRQTALEKSRSDILQELTRRSEEARNAEEALMNARKNLATGALQPGGPMDAFGALRSQFLDAIKRAKRGDAGAAGEAASLAQSLLQSGRGIYASGTGYADLFRMVNTQLLAAEAATDTIADNLEAQLDKETFADVTEKSTAALLRGLATLNESLKDIETRIKEQTKKREQLEAKAKVA